MFFKTQLFVSIFAALGVAASAKSNVPSSRQVFRAGRQTSRQLKKVPKQKDYNRTCSQYDVDDKNETLSFGCTSPSDSLWYFLDSKKHAQILLVAKKKGKKRNMKFPNKGGKNSLGVRFLSLVEYIPNANTTSPAYDFEVETVQIQELKDFGKFTNPVKEDGVYTTSLTSKDQVVTLKYKVTEANGKAKLSQHKLKYDFIVENFDWKKKEEGSLLALIAEMYTPSGKGKAKKKLLKGKKDKSEVLEMDAGMEVEAAEDGSDSDNDYNIFGTYTWVSSAETKNGTVLAITATQPADQKENATKQKIAFSFLNSTGEEKISWDPEIGIGYTSTSDESSAFSLSSATQLMVGALFSLAYFW
jgi:hypothetical protein